MEYQKVINLLGNTTNETLKIWTKTWVEINDDTKRDGSDVAGKIKLATTQLKPSLCDYSDVYILLEGSRKITEHDDDDAEERADEIKI